MGDVIKFPLDTPVEDSLGYTSPLNEIVYYGGFPYDDIITDDAPFFDYRIQLLAYSPSWMMRALTVLKEAGIVTDVEYSGMKDDLLDAERRIALEDEE